MDGHKALSSDGIFCEFAVFEPPELAAIPFAPGRVVWRRPDLAAELPRLAPGYPFTPQAALAILAALQRLGASVDPSLKQRICGLARG